MQLQLSTWPEVEAYLKRSTGIIIPTGSTEQHGPTGLIGTDALTAEVIGRRVGEETGALVAPTVSIGMAQHHMAFKGSITYRPSTLILVVRDMVMSLARHMVEYCGAPSLEEALQVAEDEVRFAGELCADKPINTVFTVRRVIDKQGNIREEFREIKPPSDEPQHARIWDVVENDA